MSLGMILTPSCSSMHPSEHECMQMLDKKHRGKKCLCDWGTFYKTLCVLVVPHVFQCEWHCCSRSGELLRHKWPLLSQWCTSAYYCLFGLNLVWRGVLQSTRSEGGGRWSAVPKRHKHISWQKVNLSSLHQSLIMYVFELNVCFISDRNTTEITEYIVN